MTRYRFPCRVLGLSQATSQHWVEGLGENAQFREVVSGHKLTLIIGSNVFSVISDQPFDFTLSQNLDLILQPSAKTQEPPDGPQT